MDFTNRRYFIVNFSGCSHNMRVDIIKQIPSVKIRRGRTTYYSGRNQMMIGCNNKYCDALLFEIRKAKRNEGYCTCHELGYVLPIDMLKDNKSERRNQQ